MNWCGTAMYLSKSGVSGVLKVRNWRFSSPDGRQHFLFSPVQPGVLQHASSVITGNILELNASGDEISFTVLTTLSALRLKKSWLCLITQRLGGCAGCLMAGANNMRRNRQDTRSASSSHAMGIRSHWERMLCNYKRGGCVCVVVVVEV